MAEPALSYLMARIQGRWRTLPGEAEWRDLEAIGNAGSVLETARNGALKPWLEGLALSQGAEAVEHHLRQRWQAHGQDVAHWLPERWRDAAAWADHLPRLPALDHLLRGGPPMGWTLSDPCLAPLATVFGDEQRQAALAKTPLAPLAQRPDGLLAAWLVHWRELWPESDAMDWSIEELGRAWSEAAPIGMRRLRRACRRTAPAPATAFLHLGLVGLHLQRLRGLLVRRLLFTEVAA